MLYLLQDSLFHHRIFNHHTYGNNTALQQSKEEWVSSKYSGNTTNKLTKAVLEAVLYNLLMEKVVLHFMSLKDVLAII